MVTYLSKTKPEVFILCPDDEVLVMAIWKEDVIMIYPLQIGILFSRTEISIKRLKNIYVFKKNF